MYSFGGVRSRRYRWRRLAYVHYFQLLDVMVRVVLYVLLPVPKDRLIERKELQASSDLGRKGK
jgi:hypothetical protein